MVERACTAPRAVLRGRLTWRPIAGRRVLRGHLRARPRSVAVRQQRVRARQVRRDARGAGGRALRRGLGDRLLDRGADRAARRRLRRTAGGRRERARAGRGARALRRACPACGSRRCRCRREFPAERFDLIVVSEVAYYWSDADLRAAIDAIARAAPGGTVELVHWLPTCPTIRAAATPPTRRSWPTRASRRIRGARAERYRIDVLARAVSDRFAALPAPRPSCRLTVAIPARDERARRSPARSPRWPASAGWTAPPLAPDLFDVVVFANDCRDRTAQVARARGAPHLAVHVVEGALPARCGARRHGAQAGDGRGGTALRARRPE